VVASLSNTICPLSRSPRDRSSAADFYGSGRRAGRGQAQVQQHSPRIPRVALRGGAHRRRHLAAEPQE